MDIITEYRKVTEEMAITTSELRRINIKINNNVYEYCPQGLKGIDYTAPRVQESNVKKELFENYRELQELFLQEKKLNTFLNKLKEQRLELEKCINCVGGIEKKALMLRIKGYTNREIADKLHYSLRGVEDIFKRVKKRNKIEKERGENVV